MVRHRRRRRRKFHFGKWALGFLGIAMVVFLFSAQLLFQQEGSGLSPQQGTIPSRKMAALPSAQQEASPPREELSEEGIRERLAELQEQFSSGKYWNHCGYELSPGEESWSIITETPCDHDLLGTEFCNSYHGATGEFFPFYDDLQCLGFSSMLSDRIFGADAPVFMHRSYERLRLGDQIRLTGENHSMLVIEKWEAGIAVAEVNRDYNTCEISWGREIDRQTLEDYREEIEYFTRYSDPGEAAVAFSRSEEEPAEAPSEAPAVYIEEVPSEDGE